MINPFEYIEELKSQWAWQSAIKESWGKINEIGTKGKIWVLKFNISTGGLSDHEAIMANIDTFFWDTCWNITKRGGHYEFIINPYRFGYRLVNEYARDNDVSRQSIYNYPDKFKWIHVSKGVKFIKPKLR